MSSIDHVMTSVQEGFFREHAVLGEGAQIKVNGSCMWPSVRHGSVVTVRQVCFKDIAIGDVLFMRSKEGFRCHRVYWISKEQCFTKPDALLVVDKPVGAADILGKVVAVDWGGHCRQIDGLWHRVAGALIVWSTFVTAPCLMVVMAVWCCVRSERSLDL